jgi:adenylate kinase
MKNKGLLTLIISTLILPACNLGSGKSEKISKQSFEEGKQMGKTIFSFLGAPGSGKGTLAELCVSRLNFKVLSTGNLCRAAMSREDEKSKLITSIIKEGKLVPDDLITDMVEEWLEKEATGEVPVILDGYPRTEKQAELLLSLLNSKFKEFVFRVVSLNVPEQEIVDRITSRLICENKSCQSTASLKLLKDPNRLICEKCGANLIRRPDDSEQVVWERLKVYARYIEDVLSFYAKNSIKVEEINASGLSIDEVFNKFKAML